jgi:hypothetical protein
MIVALGLWRIGPDRSTTCSAPGFWRGTVYRESAGHRPARVTVKLAVVAPGFRDDAWGSATIV